MSDLANLDLTNLTPSSFEERLPDLFASAQGKLSEDPRLASFFAANPDCAALVRDFETIAETAKRLFDDTTHEPSDDVWSGIVNKLHAEPQGSGSAVDLCE